jgi:hypothetical protein
MILVTHKVELTTLCLGQPHASRSNASAQNLRSRTTIDTAARLHSLLASSVLASNKIIILFIVAPPQVWGRVPSTVVLAPFVLTTTRLDQRAADVSE